MRHLQMLCLVGALSGPARAGNEDPQPAEVVSAAGEAGLPTDALSRKLQEGLAKGIPSHRIAQVLTARVDELAAAQRLLPTDSTGPVIEAAAAALAAGARSVTITRIAADAGGPHAARALQTLADLLRAGLPETEATQLVASAAGSATPGTALLGLVPAATILLDAGMAPSGVVGDLSVPLSAGQSPIQSLEGGPPSHSNAGGNGTGTGNSGGNGNGNGTGNSGGNGNGNGTGNSGGNGNGNGNGGGT